MISANSAKGRMVCIIVHNSADAMDRIARLTDGWKRFAARIAHVVRLARLLRQYMHNTENAVTMRLSTILKTIKQPL